MRCVSNGVIQNLNLHFLTIYRIIKIINKIKSANTFVKLINDDDFNCKTRIEAHSWAALWLIENFDLNSRFNPLRLNQTKGPNGFSPSHVMPRVKINVNFSWVSLGFFSVPTNWSTFKKSLPAKVALFS